MRPVALLLTLVALAASASAQDASLAITPVTVVDVTGGTLHPNQTVLIEGRRIAAVGSVDEVAVPDDAETVDTEGGFLIPGLWDMHVHTFNNNAQQPPNTWTFPLYLANGVTGVRDMFVKPGEQAEQLQVWREEIEAGTFVGPRFGDVGTLVDGTPPIQNSDTVTTVVEAQAFVSHVKEAGIDFVKVYSRLAPDAYHALVDAAREAGLYVAGHGPNSVSSFDVAEAGQRSIEHLTGIHETCSSHEDSLRTAGVWVLFDPGPVVTTFDAEKCKRLYASFAEHSTWQVPTLVTNRIWDAAANVASFRQDEGIVYIPTWEAAEWEWVSGFLGFTPSAEREHYDNLYALEKRIVGEMYNAGVPLLAGTDFGNPYIYPGFSLIDELGILVEAGLPPLAALQTATLNPARYFDRTDELGTVAEGKLADLVLLDANPLEDLSNLRHIRAVIANGNLYTREQIDQMKQEVLIRNYRDALAQPVPLGVHPREEAELQPFTGLYKREGRDAEAQITIQDGNLRVSFGKWIDPLEPIGGTLFRVLDSNVLYVFQMDAEDTVWGVEINDGSNVVRFRRPQ